MSVQGSGVSVQVDGLKKLQRDLKKAENGLTKDVKAVNKEAAEIVAQEVRTRAPVRSGRLKKSVRAGATLTSGVVRIGNASTPYSKPIIFGWPKHHIKPNPFPYTALDVRRAEVMYLYEKRISEIVDKAFI